MVDLFFFQFYGSSAGAKLFGPEYSLLKLLLLHFNIVITVLEGQDKMSRAGIVNFPGVMQTSYSLDNPPPLVHRQIFAN